MVSKLNNTKWDVSNWTVEMKINWQKEMFNLGYTWANCQFPEVINLEAICYFVYNKEITHGNMRETFDEHTHTPLTREDVFSEKKTKPSIFDKPRWVTCCDDSLGQVTLGKDYKVVNVNNDNYTIIMDTGVEGSLHKDRFYRVTYEDLLPEKDTSESKEEGFEDLVISPDALEKGGYIVKSKFSEEQLRFVQKVMDIPCNLIFDDKIHAFFLHGHISYKFKELSFNDIFKHKSEI